MPTVITASGNFEAKWLSLVAFHKYHVEKAVHMERTLRTDKDDPTSEGFPPLVDSPGTCQTG